MRFLTEILTLSEKNMRIYADTSIFGGVFDKEFSNENNLYQDLIWECKEIASGIYFAIIKSDDQIEKLSIAIVK